MAEAKRRIEGAKSIGKGVKNYGRNVAGGAKIVGGYIKKGVKFAAKPITRAVRKLKEEPARLKKIDNAHREAGQKLNKEYSGR